MNQIQFTPHPICLPPILLLSFPVLIYRVSFRSAIVDLLSQYPIRSHGVVLSGVTHNVIYFLMASCSVALCTMLFIFISKDLCLIHCNFLYAINTHDLVMLLPCKCMIFTTTELMVVQLGYVCRRCSVCSGCRNFHVEVHYFDVREFVHHVTTMKITNTIALYRLIYYYKPALHVSGYVFAHRQEHLTVFALYIYIYIYIY
jgi:hypothetical protein